MAEEPENPEQAERRRLMDRLLEELHVRSERFTKQVDAITQLLMEKENATAGSGLPPLAGAPEEPAVQESSAEVPGAGPDQFAR